MAELSSAVASVGSTDHGSTDLRIYGKVWGGAETKRDENQIVDTSYLVQVGK
jgi:hypothetical protein